MPCAPGRGSGSTTILTKIKRLLKMTKWMNEYPSFVQYVYIDTYFIPFHMCIICMLLHVSTCHLPHTLHPLYIVCTVYLLLLSTVFRDVTSHFTAPLYQVWMCMWHINLWIFESMLKPGINICVCFLCVRFFSPAKKQSSQRFTGSPMLIRFTENCCYNAMVTLFNKMKLCFLPCRCPPLLLPWLSPSHPQQ